MLKTFWCFLVGHKFMQKAITGESIEAFNAMRGTETVLLYQWHVNEYCPRCGVKNPHKETTQPTKKT